MAGMDQKGRYASWSMLVVTSSLLFDQCGLLAHAMFAGALLLAGASAAEMINVAFCAAAARIAGGNELQWFFERSPVFSLMKLHGVGTFPLGFMAVAVAPLCMGCAAPVHPDPGPVSCIQLSPGSLTVAAAAAAHVCFCLAFSICFLAILGLMAIILDTQVPVKKLKTGKAALPSEGLSDFAPLQVASWCGGRPAAAQEVGISLCCQAMSAAVQSRAFVLPFAPGIEDVSSAVVWPLPGDELWLPSGMSCRY